jgi:hypothetical protein
VKVFVFGYNRYDTMTTSAMFEAEDIDHTVLVHTQEAAEQFIQHGTAQEKRLKVTNNPKGLAYQRNTALEMMEEGEWALFMVDDLKDVTELRNYDRTTAPSLPITMANQKHYTERFNNQISMRDFMKRSQQLVTKCETHGANLGGFCGINNPVYRSKHWSYNVLADGRAWVVRKTHLRFDENVQLIDDLCWTALNIKHFGLVIVNQWVLPDCRRYSAGAFGSIEERLPQKLKEAAYLVETYPDLIAFKEKAGWPYGSHAVLRQRNKPKHLMNRR